MTKRYLRYALAVIFFANFLSYLDRQVVATMEVQLTALPPKGLGLTETEFGWVGSAFTIGYMVFAPIVGYLITRHKRPHVFAVCVLIWSCATIGSGLAPGKWALLVTRFFIGVGEAGCLVIGPTLLSDYFSKEVRGRVLSAFFLALPLGGGTGYIAGAKITQWLNWHWAFYIAGAPGFLVAALIWKLIDPQPSEEVVDAHGHLVTKPVTDAPSAPPGSSWFARTAFNIWQGIKTYLSLLKNGTLLFVILAQAFAIIFLAPFLHYGIGFFESRGIDKSEAALLLAGIALIAGALGNAMSGFIGDRLARRTKGAYALLAGIAFCTGMPFMLFGFTTQAIPLAAASLGMGAFCYFLCMPAVNTQIANSVSPEKRAMAYALAVFILHSLGDTLALPAFGKVSTIVGGKHTAFLIFSFSLLLAGTCCFIAVRFAAKESPQTANQT